MKPILLAALILAGCSPAAQTRIDAALVTPPGALFCQIQLAGGGAIIAAVTSAVVTGAAPAAGPLVVVATGATRAAIDADCAKAAASVQGGVAGVPVSPPVNPATVPSVAIVAPASPVAAVK